MFFAGLEIDIAQFRRERNKSIIFGLVTTLIPLLLGTAVGLLFGYQPVAAIVLGSLLASHTLLAAPIIVRLGETRLEPVTITFGATVISDTLSLIVFAICVPIYQSGFSVSGLVVQLIEIAIFVPLILFGLSRLGAYLLKKVEDDEDAYFILMLAIVAVAGLLAQIINLPGIVGAFLAGLAVNAAVHDKPAKEKLEFFGNSFFIPIFFIVTGFLIDPVAFFQSITTNFPLASAVIGALLIGKWIAAQTVGRAFAYTPAARMTMWSLTLPQVAATLAATLSRLRYSKSRRSTPDRWPIAQCGSRADAYHFHSWTGSHRALRTSPPQRRNATTINKCIVTYVAGHTPTTYETMRTLVSDCPSDASTIPEREKLFLAPDSSPGFDWTDRIGRGRAGFTEWRRGAFSEAGGRIS